MVLDLLQQMKEEEDTTLLLVTHDTSLFRVADRKVMLRDGKIVSDDLL
jgi:ABC-type lipoprotein export system ATPase subunit